MKFPLLVFLIMFSIHCHAGDWNTETLIEETVYQSLHVIDSAQTVYIAKNPDKYYEKESGFIVGAHPSESAVIKYMAADAVIHVAVTATLVKLDAPRWVTRIWELVTIGDSARCVAGNYHIGIRAQF